MADTTNEQIERNKPDVETGNATGKQSSANQNGKELLTE